VLPLHNSSDAKQQSTVTGVIVSLHGNKQDKKKFKMSLHKPEHYDVVILGATGFTGARVLQHACLRYPAWYEQRAARLLQQRFLAESLVVQLCTLSLYCSLRTARKQVKASSTQCFVSGMRNFIGRAPLWRYRSGGPNLLPELYPVIAWLQSGVKHNPPAAGGLERSAASVTRL
jgi:hypothetical protein